MHPVGSEARIVERGDLQVEAGRRRDLAAHAALEVSLHLLGRSEEGHVAAERRVVQGLVGGAVFGQSLQREVCLEIRSPMVDGTRRGGRSRRAELGIDQLGERGRRIEIRHHDRRRRHLALTELDTEDDATLDHNAGGLGVATELAAVPLEQPGRWSAMVPRPPRTFDMVAVPGDASAKARHSALPGEAGPRKVELTARKLSMLRTGACLTGSGRKRSTTSMHAAEHGDADGLTLRLVGGAGPHLVE